MGCSGGSVSEPGVVLSGADAEPDEGAAREVKAFEGSERLRLKAAFSAQIAH